MIPWRLALDSWPDARRQRWGRLANALEDQGHPWRDAERLAFERVRDGEDGTEQEPEPPRVIRQPGKTQRSLI